MADNVNLTAGDGTIVAGTDTIGGVAYPRAKLVWGPDGTVNDADVATGKPIPVQVRSATGLIPVGEPTDAKSTATDTTSVSGISIWKQISASVQSLVSGLYVSGTTGSLSSQILTVDAAAAASSIAANEDDASANADKGLKVLFRRGDAPANTSGTDGDYEIPQVSRGLAHVNPVAKFIDVASSGSITRPANATPYSAGDAVSNNATAGSVTTNTFTMSWINDDPVSIEEILMDSTDTGAGGKSLRIYLYNSDPTASSGVGGGDNAAWSQKKAGFIGSLTGTMLAASDGSHGRFIPETGVRVISIPTSGAKTVYWMLQTIDAWTPSANSTTFTPRAKGFQGHA